MAKEMSPTDKLVTRVENVAVGTAWVCGGAVFLILFKQISIWCLCFLFLHPIGIIITEFCCISNLCNVTKNSAHADWPGGPVSFVLTNIILMILPIVLLVIRKNAPPPQPEVPEPKSKEDLELERAQELDPEPPDNDDSAHEHIEWCKRSIARHEKRQRQGNWGQSRDQFGNIVNLNER